MERREAGLRSYRVIQAPPICEVTALEGIELNSDYYYNTMGDQDGASGHDNGPGLPTFDISQILRKVLSLELEYVCVCASVRTCSCAICLWDMGPTRYGVWRGRGLGPLKPS